MRILHVLPHAAGGMLRHVQTLLNGLDPGRYEQWCATPPGEALDAVLEMTSGRGMALPLDDPPSAGGLLRSGLALSGFVRLVGFDLIHGHGYRGMLLAAMAARMRRRPFVFTAHTLPDEVPPKTWRAAKSLARGAAGIVCVSEAVARELSARLRGWTRLRPGVRVVYNGIDPGPPPGPRIPLPADLNAAGRRPIVLTAARLAPQKGIDVLVEAWAGLVPDFPEGLLLVAGDGPERPALEARAAARGVARSVRFLGFRTDVRHLLRSADAVAIPSRMEGQSLFALEAMAEGAPVAASRAGGLPEMVRDGETGLLAPPDDPAALADALRRLLSDAALAAQLAAGARRFVETEMTIERMLAGMDAFYQSAIGA
ncbi:MAG: glycosyltransferase family 4 protein [Armatimonadetes bacterium]|nr:glycosyltransferase family 4 protein [Armatimonadota bacterium]